MLEFRFIGEDFRQGGGEFEHQVDVFLVRQRLDDGTQIVKRLGWIKRGAQEFLAAGFDLGQVENVIDKLKQMFAAVQNVVGVFELARVQCAELGVAKHLGEANNGIERGSQFVAHIRQKLALRAVGRLRGLFGLLQSVFGFFAPGDVGQEPVRA